MVNIDEKELKRQIRALKKIKKGSRVGTVTRRDINGRIRHLQEKLENLYDEITPEKQELMKKIYKAKPHFEKLKIDLRKFTVKELQYHYDTKILKRGV